MSRAPGSLRLLARHVGSGRRLLATGLVAICFDALFQSAVPAVFRTVLNDLQEDPAAFVAQGWQRAALEAVVVMCGFLVFAHIGHTFTLRGASRSSGRTASR